MRRSSMSSKKGQWFLISAIIISGSLLSISFVLKDYIIADSSDVSRMNENVLLSDIENQLRKIAETGYDQPSCVNITNGLSSFKNFTESSLAQRGYLLNVACTVQCSNRKIVCNNTLSTDQMTVTRLFEI